MNNITTLLVAAVGVGMLALVNAIIADGPPSKRVEFSHAEDVEKLRIEFESQCLIYERMIRPFDQRIEEYLDEKLTEPEVKKLWKEVDEATGAQEKKVRALRKKLSARIQQLSWLRFES